MVGGQLSTSQIIEQARAAGALAPKQKENIPAKSSRQSGEKTPAPANKRPVATVDLTTQEERFVIPRLVNSAIFQKKDRPDFLLEDDVINSLPTATVANVVAQHKMTQALEKQNNLREDLRGHQEQGWPESRPGCQAYQDQRGRGQRQQQAA